MNTRSLAPRLLISNGPVPCPITRGPMRSVLNVHQLRQNVVVRAASDPPATNPPSSSGSQADPSESSSGRQGSYAIPTVLKNPGAWFVLAGVLRVVQLIDMGSMLTSIGMMSQWPWFFMGPMALLTVGPVAIGLGFLANYILTKGWMENGWFRAGLVATCFLALYAFRLESAWRLEREIETGRLRPSAAMVSEHEAKAKEARERALRAMMEERMRGELEHAARSNAAAAAPAAKGSKGPST